MPQDAGAAADENGLANRKKKMSRGNVSGCIEEKHSENSKKAGLRYIKAKIRQASGPRN